MTGFIASVFLYPNRVSLTEAFEVLEPDDGKLSRPVLRGPGLSDGVRLLDRTRRSSKGTAKDVKVVQELMRHANISVTLNIYAQAITQTKRDAQSRVVSLLLDKNEEKPSTEAYRTLTDVQNSGGDSQVVDKVGVPDGI
jgi:hypothetical protein